jgi:hypothetical protein
LKAFYATANLNEIIKGYDRIPVLPDESPLKDVKNASKIAKGTFESLRRLPVAAEVNKCICI